MRLIEFGAQLRDGCTQTFELGALLVTQFDAPIPSLIGLSHRPVFAVRVHRPARHAPKEGPAVSTPLTASGSDYSHSPTASRASAL